MTDRTLLRRTFWYTLLGGLLIGGAVAGLLTLRDGVGIMVGAIWAAANLRAMEGLLAAAILPRDHPRNVRAVILWATAKLGVYVLAIWLLVVAPFPVVGLTIGLTVMLAALVLAALTTRSQNALESPRRGDDDPA